MTMMLTQFPALPATRPDNAPPAFHLLIKPTGAICNLDCAYCFFLSKELLYPGSRFRMADELLENYRPPIDRGASNAGGHHRLAGRRADVDGAGVLPTLDRVCTQICAARSDDPAHHPDQRHVDRRRVGGVLQGAQLPRRDQHRRAARDARRVSTGQRRRTHLR